MVNFESVTAQYFVYGILIACGLILLALGIQVGRWVAGTRYRGEIQKQQSDLFTTQSGFKKLYEVEIDTLKKQVAALVGENDTLTKRAEDYRRKAAGFGGLFNAASKKSDAMYALLLENESLEEALHKQNQKLTTERTDAVQESLRNIGYRRVLMSQLLNDNRIKEYVREIMDDDGRLPAPEKNEPAKLPAR